MIDCTKYCNYKNIVNELNKVEIQKCLGFLQKRILREYSDLFNEFTNSCIYVTFNEETNSITIIVNCITPSVEKNETNSLFFTDKSPTKRNYENTLRPKFLSIRCNDDNKIQSYMFIIDKKYPFVSPKIYYNNKPYKSLLEIPSARFRKYLQKITNKNCLCCYSLDCKNNWSPGVTLKLIITDINKNRNYKKMIIIAILIDQLKEKYLIDDIDILTYIYEKTLKN
jgi:hypothetical protein